MAALRGVLSGRTARASPSLPYSADVLAAQERGDGGILPDPPARLRFPRFAAPLADRWQLLPAWAAHGSLRGRTARASRGPAGDLRRGLLRSGSVRADRRGFRKNSCIY